MNRVQVIRLADHLPRHTPRLFEQNIHLAAHHFLLDLGLLLTQQGLKPLQARIGLHWVNVETFSRGRAGTGRVFETKGLPIADLADQLHRVFEILLGLFREADNEIPRDQDIGTGRADAVDQRDIFSGRMLAVHALEDSVTARLHRQMQVRHQLGAIAVGGDEVIIHVIWMGCGKADALQPVDLSQAAHEARQTPALLPVRPVIGVYVLSQQRDFPHPARDQIFRFRENAPHGSANLCATGVGDNTESAELVAAFLNRQKCGWRTARLGPARRAGRQVFELVFGRELRVQRPFATPCLCLEGGQIVIALRANHQIHHRCARHDLGAFGLRNAASNTDLEIRVVFLEPFQTAQLGIHLFGGLFADMAGVEQDQVRIFWRVGLRITTWAHGFGHALTVIYVHLTAICLDVELALLGHRCALQGCGN